MNNIRTGNFQKMCDGKIAYSYVGEADRAIKRMIKKCGLNSKEKLHAYHCPFCLCWHIGHYK